MQPSSLCYAALVLTAWLATAQAFAAPLLVLAEGDCAESQATGYASLLAAELDRRPRTEVLPAERFAAALSAPLPKRLDPLRRRLQRAFGDLEQGRYLQVEEVATAVLGELGTLGPSAEAWALRRQALLQRARARLRLGREEPAAVDLLEAEPAAAGGEGASVPEDLRALLGPAARLAPVRPLQELAVLGTGPGVELFLDGRPVGQAPQTLRLPEGNYLLLARSGEALGLPQRVHLGPGGAHVVAGPGEPGRLFVGHGSCVELGANDSARQTHLVDLARAVGAQKLVLVSVQARPGEPERLRAQLVSGLDGQELQEGSMPLREAAAPSALSALARLLSP